MCRGLVGLDIGSCGELGFRRLKNGGVVWLVSTYYLEAEWLAPFGRSIQTCYSLMRSCIAMEAKKGQLCERM